MRSLSFSGRFEIILKKVHSDGTEYKDVDRSVKTLIAEEKSAAEREKERSKHRKLVKKAALKAKQATSNAEPKQQHATKITASHEHMKYTCGINI